MSESYDRAVAWFLQHPDQTERIRPMTVEEQVVQFERTGDIHEWVRVKRDDWFWSGGRRVTILRPYWDVEM